MLENLTFDNALLYKVKNYDNPQCVNQEEFDSDMMRVVYLKRLFKKYKENGTLKERLIINHIIILSNVLSVKPMVRILFLEIEEQYWGVMVPFLEFLGYLPDVVDSVMGKNIHTSDITMDSGVINSLRNLK